MCATGSARECCTVEERGPYRDEISVVVAGDPSPPVRTKFNAVDNHRRSRETAVVGPGRESELLIPFAFPVRARAELA